MTNLPPGESLIYFVSNVVAFVAYLVAFGFVLDVTLDLRSNGGGLSKVIAELASWLAGLWLLAAVGHLIFIGTLLAQVGPRGTIRNYILATVTIVVSWNVRVLLRDLHFRTYRPDAVKDYLKRLQG